MEGVGTGLEPICMSEMGFNFRVLKRLKEIAYAGNSIANQTILL